MSSYTKDQFLAAFKKAAAKPREEFLVVRRASNVWSLKGPQPYDLGGHVEAENGRALVCLSAYDSLSRSLKIEAQGRIFTEVASFVTELFIAGTKHLSMDCAEKARRFAEAFNRAALWKAGLDVVAMQAAISAVVVAACGAVFWRLRK